MKKFILAFAVCFGIGFQAVAESGQPVYDEWFTDGRLRLDLVFSGNAEGQSVWLQSVHFEKNWSGPRQHLLPPFDYGGYQLDVYDSATSTRIYSIGFCSLFAEWRTTEEARRLDKAFSQSLRMPCPKQPVKAVISARRLRDGQMATLGEFGIDPADLSINREQANGWKVTALADNGPADRKVDLVFLAEGYTADEMPKFLSDARRMADCLFTMEPYKHHRDDFNLWAVESVSEESGPDIPHQNIWHNTVAGSSFYTFYTDRYLTAPDQRLVATLACQAPCDALCVLVNTDKYGGGGIYNFYALCASDGRFANEVFIHEFGHSFAGLGDEYYESETAYNDMYPLTVEPWEPNITTCVDLGRKWQDMMNVPGVGLFEGGGYSARGIWRPAEDCRMKTNTAEGFCPVCQRAIARMIDYWCDR